MIGRIIDSNREVVVQWDTQKKTIDFHHSTLKAVAERGIEIPAHLQSQYDGRSRIVLPKQPGVNSDFDLFIQAFTGYYFNKELAKQGFSLQKEPTTPTPSPYQKA